MEEIKFKSLTDLYKRIYPALKTKTSEIYLEKKIKINEIEIWNYLKNNIWINSEDLNLYEMVKDILSFDANLFLEKIRSNNDN